MLTKGQLQLFCAITEGAVEQHGWGAHGRESTGFTTSSWVLLRETHENKPKMTKTGSTHIFTATSTEKAEPLKNFVHTVCMAPCRNFMA